MNLPSIYDVFKTGIGPSSSHTLGAIKSGIEFREKIYTQNLKNSSIEIELCGSFALTGKGHLTDIAIICGLNGLDIEKDGENFLDIYKKVIEQGFIEINNEKIPFDPDKNIIWNYNIDGLVHPNTVRYRLKKDGKTILEAEYHSIGGGLLEGEKIQTGEKESGPEFKNLTEIIDYCKKKKMDFVEFVTLYEHMIYGHTKKELNKTLLKQWKIMKQRIDDGLKKRGTLPGKLKLKRRAAEMFEEYLNNLREWRMLSREITLASIYAIAVAEENANGAVIVTSPTCGSAGVLPATLRMLQERYHLDDMKIVDALKIAGLISAIVMKNGSISGAEVGCQGEIGVASAMAAASAAYLLGGTLDQIEFSAEIALEHHLGLTCDPVAGLVQIPCIERNGVGAVEALNAANLALLTRSGHQISFDNAVQTMMETGKDMNSKYKETSLGGLAHICKC